MYNVMVFTNIPSQIILRSSYILFKKFTYIYEKSCIKITTTADKNKILIESYVEINNLLFGSFLICA